MFCHTVLRKHEVEFCDICLEARSNKKRKQLMAANLYVAIGRIYYNDRQPTPCPNKAGISVASKECLVCTNCHKIGETLDKRKWVECRALAVQDSIVAISDECYAEVQMTCTGNHRMTLDEVNKDLLELLMFKRREALVRRYGRKRTKVILGKTRGKVRDLTFADCT